jgi:hypothetical protein
VKRLLNISTCAEDLQIFENDWTRARHFCTRNGFDGYELYPLDSYDFNAIPSNLIVGLHLRFYPILEPLWRNDRTRLREVFGDDETVALYYGGADRQALVDVYRQELSLAKRLGCEYVVFHVSQSVPESVHTWHCPWTWQQTVELCAEIMSEVARESTYTGNILFENLWLPGSMRLDSPDEVALLLQKLDHPRWGLVLDTGHVLNKNQNLRSEAEGVAYLLETVRNLGDVRHMIKGVHLTRSLSADAVKTFRDEPDPFAGAETFWERLAIAHRHVFQMDQHDAFDDPGITELFRLVSPDYVVFEFSYRDGAEWQGKIDRQKRALAGG